MLKLSCLIIPSTGEVIVVLATLSLSPTNFASNIFICPTVFCSSLDASALNVSIFSRILFFASVIAKFDLEIESLAVCKSPFVTLYSFQYQVNHNWI